jgi:hypothetical protein
VNELIKNRIYLDNCCLNTPYDDLDNLNVQLEFDYTKWQENLIEDMTIEEIYNGAAKLRNENKNA